MHHEQASLLSKGNFVFSLAFIKDDAQVMALSFCLDDTLMINVDVLLELLPHLGLVLLHGIHLRVEVVLLRLHRLNVRFLLLDGFLGFEQFLILVLESIQLSLETVWLLVLDHLHVSFNDLVDLLQATMRKAVTLQGHLR